MHFFANPFYYMWGFILNPALLSSAQVLWDLTGIMCEPSCRGNGVPYMWWVMNLSLSQTCSVPLNTWVLQGDPKS